MRDEDGYLEAGDLVSGGYGALEGDLGQRVRPLAGFGRDIEPVEEEEVWPGVIFEFEPEGFQTSAGAIVYRMPKWES